MSYWSEVDILMQLGPTETIITDILPWWAFRDPAGWGRAVTLVQPWPGPVTSEATA